MFIVVGLGNPGKEYQNTRHNVGFMVIDKLNERYRGTFTKSKSLYFSSKIAVANNAVLLVKPITFMNLSGRAVQHVVDYFKVEDFSQLLIVLDDFNLPFGTVRLKPSGSAGGQKGLASVLQTLQTNEIARLRIGIGNGFQNATSHVLSTFNKQEQKSLDEIIDWAADSVESFVTKDIENTMNFYNRNILENSP